MRRVLVLKTVRSPIAHAVKEPARNSTPKSPKGNFNTIDQTSQDYERFFIPQELFQFDIHTSRTGKCLWRFPPFEEMV